MINNRNESAHISPRLLNVLGGEQERVRLGGAEVSLVHDGAYLWGAEDREKGQGILNHVLLARRTALVLGRALKLAQAPGFERIDLDNVSDAATLHDVTKLYGEDREKLTVEQKRELGLPDNFREIMDEVDEVGVEWLKKNGFPPQVYRAIVGHDFPRNIADDPYWKIVLVADYMSGQKVMTVEERLLDVRTRWIDEPLARAAELRAQGVPEDKLPKPRIEPERFDVAYKNIKAVASEIFGAIGMSDVEFIDTYQLNNPASMDRGERFIRRTAQKGKEAKAKGLLSAVVSDDYGKISYHDQRETRDPQHSHK